MDFSKVSNRAWQYPGLSDTPDRKAIAGHQVGKDYRLIRGNPRYWPFTTFLAGMKTINSGPGEQPKNFQLGSFRI